MRTFLWSCAGLLATANAQFNGWSKDQVNTSICTWYQPRAALIRDTVYIDGGNVFWSPGLDDGTIGEPMNWGNYRGVIFRYNLSDPFDEKTNVTKLLIDDTLSKAIGGDGNANGAAPNFVDGALLANDAEFFMYAGALTHNEAVYDDPDADYVLGYEAYQYGADVPAWAQGFNDKSLPKGINRYVAYGAAVNAPSENKAWYISGLTSPSGGDIYSQENHPKNIAKKVSNRMIELDMKTQHQETWTNKTLDKPARGRAQPEAVWVPVGEQGIIVMLGGVTYPEWAGTLSESDDEEASKKQSPAFMSAIDIYDVANDKWYQQKTKDGPGQRTRGCAVVAPASDFSSFNIYYYGGYNGLNVMDSFYDDVWVLSLPSFTWTLLNNGSDLHARAGHKCFTPYSDQMMIFGGDTSVPGSGKRCLDKGPIVLFNLTSGEWMDAYDPDKHDDYGVPSKVQDAIGGDAAGGATLTTPSPSGWATGALEDLFSKSYDMDKITTWGPYASKESSTGRPELPDSNDGNKDNGGGGGGIPSWVAPVLGVVLGLMVITAAIVVFCLWRRRKIFKNRSSDYGTEDAGDRILSWMRGQRSDKAPTVTTSDDYYPLSPEMGEVKAAAPGVSSPTSPHPTVQEMGGTPLAELHDTSAPAELSDTQLSPGDIVDRHSRVASNVSRSMSHQSYSTFSGATDDHSISHGSLRANGGNGEGSAPQQAAHQGQMQSLSETLAGAGTGQQASAATRAERDDSGQLTPVSPPSAADAGDDYVSARPLVSPLRKSMFRESEEDMGKEGQSKN